MTQRDKLQQSLTDYFSRLAAAAVALILALYDLTVIVLIIARSLATLIALVALPIWRLLWAGAGLTAGLACWAGLLAYRRWQGWRHRTAVQAADGYIFTEWTAETVEVPA